MQHIDQTNWTDGWFKLIFKIKITKTLLTLEPLESNMKLDRAHTNYVGPQGTQYSDRGKRRHMVACLINNLTSTPSLLDGTPVIRISKTEHWLLCTEQSVKQQSVKTNKNRDDYVSYIENVCAPRALSGYGFIVLRKPCCSSCLGPLPQLPSSFSLSPAVLWHQDLWLAR